MVWVDPAPPLRVGLAFEDLHAEVEGSWIKCHHLKKENIELARKNKALKKKLRERDEMLLLWALLLVGISMIVALLW